MPRVLEPDAKLVRAILPQLAEIEASLETGATQTVQPYDRDHCRHGQIKVEGYNLDQVDEALKFLVEDGLADNGGVASPMLGIQFKRLTKTGRELLARAAARKG